MLITLAVVSTIGFFLLAIRKFKRVIQLNLGIDAETAAGQELSLLMRDGAWVYHDIPYQYGNIDHVIVSTGGVFAIETKGISKPTDPVRSSQESATLSVEGGALVLPHGRTKVPLEQAKRHATWLRSEIQRRFGISVKVIAVVAVPGWMVNGGFNEDCWVINPKRGNSLRTAVTKKIIDEKAVAMIAAWVEDLARTIEPKSKDFDLKSDIGY